MREGFGMITCGKCHQRIPVIWTGKKFKMPCPRCKSNQTVTNTRLKNFKPFEVGKHAEIKPLSKSKFAREGLRTNFPVIDEWDTAYDLKGGTK